MRRVMLVVAAAIIFVSAAAIASASPKYPYGKICGATKCVPLTGAALQVLANRTDTYNLLDNQAHAPYFRIDIVKSRDFGRRLFYVPSKHALRVIENIDAPADSYPPDAPYWRDLSATLTSELATEIGAMAPRPASHAWH